MNRRLYLCSLATVTAVVLSLVWFRGGRLVVGDAFHYVEQTKHLASSWPQQFGGKWPLGYPLFASLLTEVGLTAYWALLAVSVLGLCITSFLTATLVSESALFHWSATALFVGLGASSMVPRLLAVPMSEWLFSALVVGVIYLLHHWPRRWAIWTTGPLVVGAFCVRYVGLFLLGVMGLYALWTLYADRRKEVIVHALASCFVAGGFIALLILINIYQTGHMSGATRPSGGGGWALPTHAVHLGWGFIGVVSSKKIFTEIVGGEESLLGIAGGVLVLGLVFAICYRAFVEEKRSQFDRPAALVIGCYLVCLVLLRSISQFQPLYHPRFVIPVLFPFAGLLINQAGNRYRSVVGVLSIGVVLVGMIAAGRGISKVARGDLSTARSVPDSTLTAGDTVRVNHWAQSLSGYYENTFQYEWRREPPSFEVALSEAHSADYAVYAAQRKGRYRVKGYRELAEPYQRLCARADSIEGIELLERDETACVIRATNGSQDDSDR